MNRKMSTNKGFSIGEVMVAMFILIMGIVSAVFLAAKSTAQISDSRQAVIAMSLAQEGVELVRNIRDNNVTEQTCGDTNSERCKAFDSDSEYGWPSINFADACAVDHEMSGIHCTNPEYKLYLNPETGFYEHSSGGAIADDDFKFERRIFIDYFDIDGGNLDLGSDTTATIVTSVVTWNRVSNTLDINNATEVEQNCKINEQCVYAQTTLTSWLNYE